MGMIVFFSPLPALSERRSPVRQSASHVVLRSTTSLWAYSKIVNKESDDKYGEQDVLSGPIQEHF